MKSLVRLSCCYLKLLNFYDEQVHATVKSLTSLIEPIMISVMGTIVGTIVLAIFWPNSWAAESAKLAELLA